MRRDFLKLCGLAGLGLAVPFRPRAVRAAEKKDEPYGGPYYVVFNASGGWDTTYLMDPKGVNGINRLYKEGDILTSGAHKFAPTTKHAKGGHEQRGLLRRVRRRAAHVQRPRLLGQQPLARRPLHGDRQARQPGLPDVRRARRRLPRAGLPARVPDVRQLLGDRQPRGHVARAVPAVAPEDRQRRRGRGQRAVAVPRQVRPRPHRAGAARAEREAAQPQPRLPRAERGREHALRGPGQLEGAAARDAVHPRDDPEGAARRSRPRSPWPRSRRASASPRT